MVEKNEQFDQEPDQHEDLNRLKQEIDKKDVMPVNPEQETDRLDTAKSQETQDETHEHQEELVALETNQKINLLKQQVSQQKTNSPLDYESMSDDEIARIADLGREKSVEQVATSIQNSSRIPWFIKRNV